MVYALWQGPRDQNGPDVQKIRVQGELTEVNASRLIAYLDRQTAKPGSSDLLVSLRNLTVIHRAALERVFDQVAVRNSRYGRPRITLELPQLTTL